MDAQTRLETEHRTTGITVSWSVADPDEAVISTPRDFRATQSAIRSVISAMPGGAVKKPIFVAGVSGYDGLWRIPHLLNDQIVEILIAAQEDARLGEEGRQAREAAIASDWRERFGAPDEDRAALIAKRDASRIAVDVGTLKIGDMIEKDGDLHRINYVSGEIDLNGRMLCHAWIGTFGAEMARRSASMTLSSKHVLDTWAPEDITDVIASLVWTEGTADMWAMRARSLVSALITALCDLRDQGKITLTPQLIRESLQLGEGVSPEVVLSDADKAERRDSQAKIETHLRMLNASMPQGEAEARAWALTLSDDELRAMDGKTGLIPLYLRALKGDMSEETVKVMQGVLDTLPGFSLERAVTGDPQHERTMEHAGYLTMQITKPIGMLIDDAESMKA